MQPIYNDFLIKMIARIYTGCFSINGTQTHAYNFFIVQDFSVKFDTNDADNLQKLSLTPIIVAHKIKKCSMS